MSKLFRIVLGAENPIYIFIQTFQNQTFFVTQNTLTFKKIAFAKFP